MSDAPVTYDAEKAGELIGQTANWMKEKARAGLIPHTRIGQKIRFTPQHLAEIIRAGEPKRRPVLVPRVPARRKAAGDAPVLEARTPRRKQSAA